MSTEEKIEELRKILAAAKKTYEKDKRDLLEARFDGMTHRSEGRVMKDMVSNFETFLSDVGMAIL